jgi:hypothetical protein
MDFTLKTYQSLLIALRKQDYTFQTFENFIETRKPYSIILRQDVDKVPENSLLFARIQASLGITGTYYFRIVPKSFHEKIIEEIASMGHEIGYHYENMDSCNGNIDKAYNEFCRNLAIFRKIVPIKTICMHGSPLSKYDNKTLWKHYNYRDLGIIGEPYFDLDFSKVLYLTDTGRRWDGEKVSVRDKVGGRRSPVAGRRSPAERSDVPSLSGSAARSLKGNNLTANCPLPTANFSFHSTFDIIAAAKEGRLPDQIMFTFHPQRWTDKPLPWLQELVMQGVKNMVKRLLVKRNKLDN